MNIPENVIINLKSFKHLKEKEPTMSLADKIIEKVELLPEDKQAEILDFADFLYKKLEKQDKVAWNKLSLEAAMHGMEDEEMSYSMDDLKERF